MAYAVMRRDDGSISLAPFHVPKFPKTDSDRSPGVFVSKPYNGFGHATTITLVSALPPLQEAAVWLADMANSCNVPVYLEMGGANAGLSDLLADRVERGVVEVRL